jgi:Secretion system C-terminal sorting domain/Carbohydrate-binding module 48 (Isoamylase N-terminal domain)
VFILHNKLPVMKKALPGSLILIFFSLQSFSQLLSWTPNFIQENSDPVVITVDATKGNHGLLNYNATSDVYIHTGVITNLSTGNSDWKYVKFNQNFNQPNPALQAAYLGTNKWQFTIAGGIRAYYGVPAGETILKIAILFRNGNGSLVQRNIDASDMYIPVYSTSLAVRFSDPLFQPTAVRIPETIMKNPGDNISLTGLGNKVSDMKLYLNGAVIQSAANVTSISANPVLTTAGPQVIVAEGNDGTTITTDTVTFFVPPVLPAGLKEGINYEAGNTSVTLVLYAPLKTSVSVIGDFPGSNWTAQPPYQMTNTPDGFYWTLHITGLTAGTEYSYQYLVDGTLKIADPYAEKVLAQPFTLQPGEYHVYLNRDAALPVTLVSFNGKNSGNNNVLSWAVANEQGLNYYELQRSRDGQNFSAISQITATGKSGYFFSDNITSGTSLIYYYRLKCVDKDGNFRYSLVIKIRIAANGKFAQVNPNPFKGKLLVTIESPAQDKATLIITDLSGRQLLKQTKEVSPGSNEVQIDEAGKFSKGTYLLTIIESQQTQSIRIVKGN